MGIVGIGIDIVELQRIARLHERHGEAFSRRFCLPGERLERHGEALVQHLGRLFAAKEAVLKALGTGWAKGLGLLQVEVTRLPGGAPAVRLHGAAQSRALAMGAALVHVSISHERHYATAVAILESTAVGPAST